MWGRGMASWNVVEQPFRTVRISDDTRVFVYFFDVFPCFVFRKIFGHTRDFREIDFCTKSRELYYILNRFVRAIRLRFLFRRPMDTEKKIPRPLGEQHIIPHRL